MRGYSKDSIRYFTVRNRLVPVHFRTIEGGRALHITLDLGEIYCSAGTRMSAEAIERNIVHLLERLSDPHIEDFSFEPMLDWPNRQVYFLGRKRRIDPAGDSGDPDIFVAPRESRPFVRAFDRQAIAYLDTMLQREAARARLALPEGYTIRIGRYTSMMASYFKKRRRFTFDRRLLAFQPLLIQSVVDHELCHLVSLRHDDLFYACLFKLMDRPTYMECRRLLSAGRFRELPDGQGGTPDGNQGDH